MTANGRIAARIISSFIVLIDTHIMPLAKGKSKSTVSKNIRELHAGRTFAKTEAKFGKKKADQQAVAIALNQARKSKKK